MDAVRGPFARNTTPNSAPIGLVDEPRVSLYGRETDHLRSACRCVA